MFHPPLPRLATICILFLALITLTHETPTNSIARPHIPASPPQQLQHLALFNSAAQHQPSSLSLHPPSNPLTKRQQNFQQLWNKIRLGTLWIVWGVTRINAITDPAPPSPFIQSLKNMYTQIRNAALNEWAKLPEQSSIRIVCGQLIFLLLPPADRTVPWTTVEEIAYSLLLMVSGGLGGLVSGVYVPIVTSVVTFYYLQVVMPVPEGQQLGQIPGGSAFRVSTTSGLNPPAPARPPPGG